MRTDDCFVIHLTWRMDCFVNGLIINSLVTIVMFNTSSNRRPPPPMRPTRIYYYYYYVSTTCLLRVYYHIAIPQLLPPAPGCVCIGEAL